MASQYESDFVLLRLALPVFLFFVSTFRYNGFSFVYLCLLLICPLLKRADDKKSQSRIVKFLVLTITSSSIFTLSHPILEILQFSKNVTLTGNLCSTLLNTTTQIGLNYYEGMLFYRVLRLVLPDPALLALAVVALVYFKCRQRRLARQPLLGAEQIEHHLHRTSITGDQIARPEDVGLLMPRSETFPGSPGTATAVVTLKTSLTRDHMPVTEISPADQTSNSRTAALLNRITLKQHHQLFWREWAIESCGVFATVFMTGVAGIMSPSVLSSLYLLVFIGVCTYWACRNKVMSSRFVWLRVFLLFYSALHVALYYLYQFPFFQLLIPNNGFVSRFMGLYYILQTSCQSPGEVIFAKDRRWIDFVAPPVTIFLYYVLAIETRRWLDKPDAKANAALIRQGRENVIRRLSRDPERQVLTPVVDPDSTEQSERLIVNTQPHDPADAASTSSAHNYQSLEDNPAAPEPSTHLRPRIVIVGANTATISTTTSLERRGHTEPGVTEHEVNLNSSVDVNRTVAERPLVLSLLNTAIRNSYILSFMVMMAWSVTYRSWLSFILLLSGCLLWIVPNSREACLYFSPVIVVYAICLLLLQFVYGLNLDKSLPDEVNGFNLTEIGLQKWEIPTRPLAVQIGFLIIFWLTLRLFMLERGKNRTRHAVGVELHPLSRSAGPSLDNVVFGHVDNRLYREFTQWIRILCEKYWILVCCLSMLLVSVQQPVVILRVVYMVMLLYFLIVFQLSYKLWRKQMLMFWWIVIIYSMAVLGSVYIYQFQQFPKNSSGIFSVEVLEDIGLEKFESRALFQRLLTPTLFLVVIILQVHYFHTPFLNISSMNRFRNTEDQRTHHHHHNQHHHHNTATSAGGQHPHEFGSTRSNISKDTTTSDYSDFIDDVNSAFQMVSRKLIALIRNTYNAMWRIFEVHWIKVVTLTLGICVFNEVSAANFLLLLLMVVCLPFTGMYPFFYTMGFLWAAIQILFKMTYQLKVVNDTWFTNCSAVNPHLSNMSNTKWLGLEKMKPNHSFQAYITNQAVLMVVSVMGHAIRYHQRQYYNTPRHPKPKSGIIFSDVKIDKIEDKLINFIKFLFNYTFYKVGLELCFCVTVIAACLRVDVFSVVYLLMMLVFLFSSREVCSKLWLPYITVLGILLPVQYAACLGLPPGLCYAYPWSNPPEGSRHTLLRLFQWLVLPSYETPPVAKKLMADLFQFLFACLQYHVFNTEKRPDANDYGGGDNKPILTNDLPRDMSKDFISTKESYMDYMMHAIFYWSYWVSLAIVFITGVTWITLFCLGYMILSFVYLWMGQNVMLRRRKHLLASWNFIIGYNFFVILAKSSFQLLGCVYLSELSKSLCWIIHLFGIQCMNPMAWNIYSPDFGKKTTGCESVSSGLHWDVICFLVIVFQRKVFMTQSFCHVVLDLNVQSKFASRGAYLINRKLMMAIQEQNVKEIKSLEKVREKLDKIYRRQERLGKNIPYIKEHYLLIRSGAEYLFEDESEDDERTERETSGSSTGAVAGGQAPGGVVRMRKQSSEHHISQMTRSGDDYPDLNTRRTSGIGITEEDEDDILPFSSSGDLTQRAANRPEYMGDIPMMTDEEEDEENPATTPTSRMNPIQILNTAMEYGPRNTIRQYRRSVSDAASTGAPARRASIQNHKLESMSETEEVDTMCTSTSGLAGGSTPQATTPDATPKFPPLVHQESFEFTPGTSGAGETSTRGAGQSGRGWSDPTSNKTATATCEDPSCNEMAELTCCPAGTQTPGFPPGSPTPRDVADQGTGTDSYQTCIAGSPVVETKPGGDGGGWSKFKASILVMIIFLSTATDSVIRFFNTLTREYRRIRRTLDQEKLLVKKRVIAQIQEADENTVQLEKIVLDILKDRNDISRESDTNRDWDQMEQEEVHRRKEFKRSRSRFFLLFIAMGNLTIVYSELLCYFLLILNHLCSANVLSLAYPLMVFLWAMLSVPRPSKNFWITLITYTEIVIAVKYIFQFKFISELKGSNVKDALDTFNIIGIETSNNYATFDLIQLLFIFLHRGYLKNNGLWRDHTEFTEDLEKAAKDNNGITVKKNTIHERPSGVHATMNPIVKMTRFYTKMTDPKFNKKVDVYVYMFLCEFISFLIIIFGYVSFGPSTGSDDTAFEFISSNKIPVPFISMLIAQFLLIIVDRALFLRKQVLGKFIFQILHVILIHIWLFFLLPHITSNSFTSTVAPQMLYFFKCIYFGLSAYQVRSGYPQRILGNFLTKNYNYINMILFKAYLIVPFLYELRNVMDWMWTDTSLALYHWMELEDVFAKIFALKCWRRSELEYPTPRGALKNPTVKYIVGGLLLSFVFLCFWGPLTLGSVIGTTFVVNPPLECTFGLSFGGFPLIFSFTAREGNLVNAPPDLLKCLTTEFNKNVSARGFLQNFHTQDLSRIKMDSSSGSVWAITPPSFSNLIAQLESPNKTTVVLNFHMQCRRSPREVESSQLTVNRIFTRRLTEQEKANLLQVLHSDCSNNCLNESARKPVEFQKVYPRYIVAKKDALEVPRPMSNESEYYVSINASLCCANGTKWWELKEKNTTKENCVDAPQTEPNEPKLTIIAFNERVSDNLFGKLYSSYGIIGVYATYIFVAHRLLRVLYSDISYIIKYEELPHVDRILDLCHDIYLVRENKRFVLEEQLFAKLIYLYRSSDMLIKWTRHRKQDIEKHSDPKAPENVTETE